MRGAFSSTNLHVMAVCRNFHNNRLLHPTGGCHGIISDMKA